MVLPLYTNWMYFQNVGWATLVGIAWYWIVLNRERTIQLLYKWLKTTAQWVLAIFKTFIAWTLLIIIIIITIIKISVGGIIQFEVESNCATFLQMSIISHSSPTAPISAANVNVFSFLQKFSIISTQARHPHLITEKQLDKTNDTFF